MKKLIPFALLGLAMFTVSCKEETAGEKAGKAIDAGIEKANEGAKAVEDATKPK